MKILITLISLISLVKSAEVLISLVKSAEVLKTLTALDDLISWAKAHHYLLIVDFLFSIRVAQGELEMLVSESDSWPVELGLRLKLVNQKLAKLTELTFADIQHGTDEYYNNFSRLVDTKYYISSTYPTLRSLGNVPTFPDSTSKDAIFDEDESDACMKEILGSEDAPQCTISASCFSQMTNGQSEEYQLTHQLLYFVLAQTRGCGDKLRETAETFNSDIDNLMHTFTAKMYSRMSGLLKENKFDLFSEMVMIGQMLNYREFYASNVIELLLVWQDTTGCYNDESAVSDELKQYSQFMRRKIFADEIVDETCSEHMTALALIILALTLRHQVSDDTAMEPDTLSRHYHLTLAVLAFLGAAYLIAWCKKRRLRITRHFLV